MSLFQKILATILVILAAVANHFNVDYVSMILSVLTLLVIFIPVKANHAN